MSGQGFTISAAPTFEQEVEIPGYRHGIATFVFVYVPPAELKERTSQMGDQPTVEALAGIIKDWDIKDDNGKPVPYSPEALGVLMDALYCVSPIYRAWLTGLTEARVKN